MALKDEMDDIFGDRCVFGMDFGTTKSLVAYKESKNSPPKIPNYQGHCQGGMPMLFWRDAAGNEWIGDQVVSKNGLAEDPLGVCRSMKMKLDQEYIILNGHKYKPRYITLQCAKRLLEISREILEMEFVDMNLVEIVVGIPAVFSAAAHREMELIQLEATGCKRVRLVAEPILAALVNDYYTQKIGRVPMPTLVFDGGGGTTDVVMLIPTGNPDKPYRTEHPMGLPVAGDDCDEKMEELAMEKIRQNPGTLNMTVMENKNHFARRRLRDTARKAKESLSSEESCVMEVSDFDGGTTRVTITKAEYEDRIRPLVKQMVDVAAKVLEKCNMGAKPDIEILLVGGMTYTPLIKKMLAEKFNWLPPERIMQRFPEKAVALGAAIFAERPAIVDPKVSYGYGVNTYTADGKREVIEVLIPANAKLPAKFVSNYTTLKNNQKFVRFNIFEILEGQSGQILDMSKGNKTEYCVRHPFPHAVEEGTPVKVTTEVTEDGTLRLLVEDYLPDGKPTNKVITMCDTVMAK